MTQRYVPVIPRALAAPMLALSLFLIVGPMGGVASAEAPSAPSAQAASAVAQARPRVTDRELTLLTPVTADTIITRRPVFSGTGTAGDVVTVWPEDGDLYCYAIVGTDGKWSCTPTRDLPVGNQVIAVNESTPGTPGSKGLVRLRLFVTPNATTTEEPCPPGQDDQKKKDDHHEQDHHEQDHHSIFDW
ncbi:MAG: large repetitive protein [Streptomyces sp.]|nr:large repetitive protein [Streptomyces sp.]